MLHCMYPFMKCGSPSKLWQSHINKHRYSMAWKKFVQKWSQYKYRFVPWIAVNFKNRSIRTVSKGGSDKLATDEVINDALISLFSRLLLNQSSIIDVTSTSMHIHHAQSPSTTREENLKFDGHISSAVEHTKLQKQFTNKKEQLITSSNSHSFSNSTDDCERPLNLGNRPKLKGANDFPEPVLISGIDEPINSPHQDLTSADLLDNTIALQKKQQYGNEEIARNNLEVMGRVFGFTIERAPSVLKTGGRGVRVTRGSIPKGSLLALYPGTVYYPAEPILFQSLGNPFIFRCIDSILIDGNDKSLSKFLFRSCSQRDRVGPYFTSDMSWLTEHPANPLAVGQYINNHNKEYPANVAYSEFDVPESFPFHLRQYIPNVFYSPTTTTGRLMRMVVLISTRDICQGEELFSSYFTVVH